MRCEHTKIGTASTAPRPLSALLRSGGKRWLRCRGATRPGPGCPGTPLAPRRSTGPPGGPSAPALGPAPAASRGPRNRAPGTQKRTIVSLCIVESPTCRILASESIGLHSDHNRPLRTRPEVSFVISALMLQHHQGFVAVLWGDRQGIGLDDCGKEGRGHRQKLTRRLK